jgi:dTDP-4-amino-4,6-dideoxygalactose transaminase
MYKGLESSAQNNLPVAHKIANEVICLPIYSELDIKDIKEVANILRTNK